MWPANPNAAVAAPIHDSSAGNSLYFNTAHLNSSRAQWSHCWAHARLCLPSLSVGWSVTHGDAMRPFVWVASFPVSDLVDMAFQLQKRHTETHMPCLIHLIAHIACTYTCAVFTCSKYPPPLSMVLNPKMPLLVIHMKRPVVKESRGKGWFLFVCVRVRACVCLWVC